jgi:hypothetical protein
MTGAIIQLAAFGIQDVYITSEPQITFFKVIYRRYTNFAIESVKQSFTTKPNFGKKATANLNHAGDMINRTYVVVDLPAIPKFVFKKTQQEDPNRYFAWVQRLGFAMIKETTVEINHKLIDQQHGEWMHIWDSLTNHHPKGISKMIGDIELLHQFSNGKEAYRLYIPLFFWFCRHIGQSLPVIALGSSDIKITVTFHEVEECYRIGPSHRIPIIENAVPFQPGEYVYQQSGSNVIQALFLGYDYLNRRLDYIKVQDSNNPKQTFTSLQEPNQTEALLNSITYANNVPFRIFNRKGYFCTPQANSREEAGNSLPSQPINLSNCFLLVDYVFLSSEERAKFARANHEYLIEQVQYSELKGIKSVNEKLNLKTNHPIKAIYYVAQLNKFVGKGTINDRFNFTASTRTDSGKLEDLNLIQHTELFLNGQPRFGEREEYYFNRVQPIQHHRTYPGPGINMYSFSLFPEKHQPSAAVNMSKIDYANMILRLDKTVGTTNSATLRVYHFGYNIFRIFYGLGTVAFR